MNTSTIWEVRPPDPRHTIDKGLTSSLSSLEQAVNYRDWLLELSSEFVRAPVLEVGAGVGTFTPFLALRGSVTAVEPSAQLASLLANALSTDERVTVVVGEVADVPADPRFESAIMYNVLEHIEDDEAVLGEIRDRLRPGGYLVIWVPAFQLLFSEYDRAVGHHRRYRRPHLKGLVESSGLEVIRSHYANAPGWFTWLIACRWMRMSPENGWAPRLFDRAVIPVVRWVENVARPPFGQSILLVARKPLQPDRS